MVAARNRYRLSVLSGASKALSLSKLPQQLVQRPHLVSVESSRLPTTTKIASAAKFFQQERIGAITQPSRNTYQGSPSGVIPRPIFRRIRARQTRPSEPFPPLLSWLCSPPLPLPCLTPHSSPR